MFRNRMRAAAAKYRFADVCEMLKKFKIEKEALKVAKRARERAITTPPFELHLLGAFVARVEIDDRIDIPLKKVLWGNINALCDEIAIIDKKLKKARRGGRKQFKDAISFFEVQKTNTFLKIKELCKTE